MALRDTQASSVVGLLIILLVLAFAGLLTWFVFY